MIRRAVRMFFKRFIRERDFLMYSMDMKIDKLGKFDVTSTRRIIADSDTMLKFTNARLSVGIELAMPLFEEITFKLDDVGINPLGDIFSSFIFSSKAKEIICQHESDIEFVRKIDIFNKNSPMNIYYVYPKYFANPVNFSEIKNNFFLAKYPDIGIYVSERFKLVWESAGLLGAEFQAHDATQLTINANAKKARLDALMMKKTVAKIGIEVTK